MGYYDDMPFDTLVGLTLRSVDGAVKGSGEVVFTVDDDRLYKLFHRDDCCESVQLEEIHGDVEDLLDTPILLAEESTSSDPALKPSEHSDSFTWTFYRLQTIKGSVQLRWLGESNGWYSESVAFIRDDDI